jgi:hypothetical protein
MSANFGANEPGGAGNEKFHESQRLERDSEILKRFV